MNVKKNLLATLIFFTSAVLGSFGYAAWTDNVLPIQNMTTVASCPDTVKMYLNQDNDNDGKADYYLYLNSNFIVNGNTNNYTAGQILWNAGGVTYTQVGYYTPLADMLYKVDSNNTAWVLDNSTFWRASWVFPYNTPVRGIATTPNKVVFERPSDNDANKNIVSVVYKYQYKYAIGFDGNTNSTYRYNQIPNMGYMDNVGLTYITILPWSDGNRKRSRSAVQNTSNCRNYELHRCGNGIVENSNNWYINQFTWEQCDGTAWVTSGYICTSSCTLQAIVAKPTCTLSVDSWSITLWTSVQASRTINGNYTNIPQITYSPITRNITWLPYTVTTPIGQHSLTPTHTGAYTLSMTVSNGAGQSICTAPLMVNPPPQHLRCGLTLSPNPVTVNQIASVWWSVTGGNFAWTYIYVTPLIAWSRPHRVNANQYTGASSAMPTQTGNYLFSMTVTNPWSTYTCTGLLNVVGLAPAKLSLTKTLVNNILYHSWDLVTFRIDFANIGTTTVHNAILSDYLPAWLTYENSQLYGVNPPYAFWTWLNGGNILVEYSGFTLAPGQTWYMLISGKFRWYQRSNQTLNNVFLDSNETDTIYASALFYVYTPSGNATVTKTSNKTSYYPGEDAKFIISVNNNGPDAIDTIQLIDTWPTNNNWCLTIDTGRLANVPMTMATTSNPYTRNLINTLPVWQTAYLYLTWHITNSQTCVGNYTNVVDLRYMVNGQLKTGQANTTINVSTTPASTMMINKSITQYGNTTGDPVTFELVYQNNWTATITSNDIVDYWPGTLHFVSASPMPTTQTTTSGGALLHRIFTTPIAPNGTGKIIINWTIN